MRLIVTSKMHSPEVSEEISSQGHDKTRCSQFDDTKPFKELLMHKSRPFADEETWTITIGYTLIVGKARARTIIPGQDWIVDMDRCLESEEGSDVTINCKDGSFKAHRIHLTTRSEVR